MHGMIPPTGSIQVSPGDAQESTAAIKPWHLLRIASEPGSQLPGAQISSSGILPLKHQRFEGGHRTAEAATPKIRHIIAATNHWAFCSWATTWVTVGIL